MRASFKRDTAETSVAVSLDLEGSGRAEIKTEIPLLEEVLLILSRATGFDLWIEARGDTPTGDHHTVEDVAITLGAVLAKLAGEGIGSSVVPSGECLAEAAVRLGEPGYSGDFEFLARSLDGVQLENITHFMRTLAYNGNLTLHLSAADGDDWQKIEALTLALGRALRRAIQDGAASTRT
ncbi:MAG: imidazoleglycerol-phosphate dehydratase [Euryarchaeota archaeon]|nr:imidazoleglycerol-phosphate dehydratase [Euryarchaeota archaeon]